MNVTFHPLKGTAVDCNTRPGASVVLPKTPPKCPGCGTELDRLQGTGDITHDHDTYYAPVRCSCGSLVGELRARMDTIFGMEEDQRVLHGPARVY